MRHRRQIVVAAGLIALLSLAARHPTAELRFITHEASDPAPHRMQAAIDLGLVGVSVLYTWTQRLR